MFLLTLEGERNRKIQVSFFFSFGSDFKVFIQTWLQDLCVPPRLCFWYLSDFALMGCSLFAFYISIRKTQMWIWISHLYFCISCLKWLIYDSLIRILVFGIFFFFSFVIGIIFIYQILIFISAEVSAFLNLGIHISIYCLSVWGQFMLCWNCD